MKILLFGATGMVGQGVLRACLQSKNVSEIVLVVRQTRIVDDPRIRTIVRQDISALADLTEELREADACFFCVGVSAVGMEAARYREITLALTVKVAKQLVEYCPDITFIYVSGAGADSSEQGKVMWARVRGETENALRRLPLRQTIIFRPGIIIPGKGIRSSTPLYRWAYSMLRPLLLLLRPLFPAAILTTEVIGEAMLNSVGQSEVQGILTTRDIVRLAAMS